MKIFVAYATLMILGGIAITLSRGGWVATGLVLAGLFGILLFHRNYRIPAAVLCLVLVVVGACLIPKANSLKLRLRETTASDYLNNDTRFDLWKPAVRLWRENIWWGIGPNHYNYRFRQYAPQVVQKQPDRVHNDYLNTLTDWGIVGVVLVSSAWVLLYAGVVKTWRFVRGNAGDFGGGNSNKFALVLGASFGLLAILAHSVVDFNLHIPANAILAITLMAFLSSSLRFGTEKYWFTLQIYGKLALSILLCAGLGFFGWQESRGVREYIWLKQANNLPDYSPDQVKALERAFAVDPNNFETPYRIGEALRRQSWEGGEDNEQLAQHATNWFGIYLKLNPYNGIGFMRLGSCLDWLGQTQPASEYFNQAVKLDPNGYFTAAWMGWHYVQTGNYAAARTWFERSKRLQWNDNEMANSYLPIVTEKLKENSGAIP